MNFEKERRKLRIELRAWGIKDERVLDAVMNVPRELFIQKEHLKEAYGNYPLPIGMKQTISQPYTVAFMLEALELKQGEKVFEIGTGSGYNACVIAEIIGKKGKVITTEIIYELSESAKRNIKKAGYKNIKVLNIDGSKGYEKEMPYDKIIVTAACREIPKELIKELKINGILVAPVGEHDVQKLLKVIKKKKEQIIENLGDFRFVPLVH